MDLPVLFWSKVKAANFRWGLRSPKREFFEHLLKFLTVIETTFDKDIDR